MLTCILIVLTANAGHVIYDLRKCKVKNQKMKKNTAVVVRCICSCGLWRTLVTIYSNYNFQINPVCTIGVEMECAIKIFFI